MKTYTSTIALATALVTAMASFSGAAFAKVSASDAAKLDSELTCIGAEKEAGKLAAAYSGKWLGVPEGVSYKSGDSYADPYADEKPLFVVDANNMGEYAEYLSPGLQALLKKYPQTFKIPVYPSHRDFRYPDWMCERSKQNAVTAEVAEDGLSLHAVRGSAPFPIPKTGQQLQMNLNYPTRTSENAVYDQAVIYDNGNIAWGQTGYKILNVHSQEDAESNTKDAYFGYANVTVRKPLRSRGQDIVTQESYNVKDKPRQAWMYDPGTRRVRQMPEFGFDMPDGPGAFRTVDDDRIFNGSPERYNWKIVGKKEVIVPYNAYKIDNPELKYKDMLTTHHINPDVMRYEVHRMWVLEAELKSNYRHKYAKRVIYLDEDSWGALLAENYDARGQLWRVNMINTKYLYDAKVFFTRVALYHDLVSGAYMADRLINEADKKPKYGDNANLRKSQFTPQYLRSKGK